MRRDVVERGLNIEDFPILQSKPDLWSDLVWIWEAFSILGASRQAGFGGPQFISVAEVLAYADFRAIVSIDEREELLHHVQKLDQIYMADYLSKNQKK